MTKKELEQKKELARLYFLQGETQKNIALKIGSSEQTISRWVKDNAWSEQRAAKTITRTELTNKLLLTIDSLLNQVNQSNDPSLMASLGDKLSKLAAVIEKLDKKASIVDTIEVFMAFGKWLQHRAEWDSDITPELVRAINKYQDLFISEHITSK